MLKKSITYTNFNNEEVTEDFFFHLSKAELVELELSQEGGLKKWLEEIVAAQDAPTLIAEFKRIILISYGKKSSDGRQFIKNQELRDEFMSTGAYSELFMELITDTNSAIEFANGIIPKGLAEEAAEVVKPDDRPVVVEVPRPPESPEPKTITKAEINAMSSEEKAQLGPRLASGEITLTD